LGIHKFYLGYSTSGLIMLLVSLISCGLLALPIGIIALVEGVIYLTKSNEQFYEEYILNKKEWF
ncbi:MAG: NINE protein, partial [Planctomycetes bacterium]|nr:NINE protein [Planctomycetota bacterium]